jgi:predicted transcriptional regulator
MEADKNRLAIRVEQLEKQMKEKTEEFKKMEKEHMWLEKEYNRMYNNIDEEHEESLKQNASGEPAEG